MRLVAVLLSAVAAAAVATDLECGTACRLQRDLTPIVRAASERYGSSVSIAVDHPKFGLSWAEGLVNNSTNQHAQPEDLYPMGSVAKTLTGASIMSLVASRRLSLDDRADQYIDPMLRAEGYPYTFQELFSKDQYSVAVDRGYNASDITVRDLLGMTSGVPDYDTTGWRHMQHALPDVDFSPLQIFDMVHGQLQFNPGSPPAGSAGSTYCSVNFMLLGYIIAYFDDSVHHWYQMNQSTILPANMRSRDEVKFGVKGPCSQYTTVHGYDVSRRVSNEVIDWSNASCTAGWTAGNVIMSARAAAAWASALYRPGTRWVLPAEVMHQMLAHEGEFYGLATMNFSGYNGRSGPLGTGWGHLGIRMAMAA